MNRFRALFFLPLALAVAMAQNVAPQARTEVDPATFPQTYTCGVSNLTPAATPTDVVTITPGVGEVVRITRIEVYATQTTGATDTISVVRRSTADTGGTFVADGVNAYDTLNVTPTLGCGHYTANPASLGTLVSTFRNYRPLIPVATNIPTGYIWEEFGDGVQPLVFRGVNDIFALNLGAQTITGLSMTIQIEFTRGLQ